jgi:hypothetical protein
MEKKFSIHFLYGSRPRKEYRDTEEKVRGGLLGGHIWLQPDDYVYGFEPLDKCKVHFFPKKKFNGIYTKDHFSEWKLSISNQKITSIEIPLSDGNHIIMKGLLEDYHTKAPYDYAILGMRCGAATYQLLSETEFFPPASYFVSTIKIPWPRILRKKLLKMTSEKNYRITRQQGTDRRIWEED